MGATSVTGVSGAGSVDGLQRGSEHMSLGVEKLIGPRVVAAGTATLDSSGDVTVDFPVLSGIAADYIAIANDTNSTVAAVNVTALTSSSIVLKGTLGHVVNWMIIKAGH